MSPPSANVGKPPLNDNDRAIIKGLYKLAGASVLNTNKGIPLGPPRPKNAVYETRGPGFIAGLSVAMAAVIIITSGRIYVRTKRKEFGWDDGLIIPAALFCVAWLAMSICQILYGGTGKHTWDMTYLEMYWLTIIGSNNQNLFLCSTAFTSASIVCFLKRLKSFSKRFIWFCNCLLFLIFVYWVSNFTILLTFCNYVPAIGDLKIRGSHDGIRCANKKRVFITTRYYNVFHAVLDFIILCTPIFIIARLQMDLMHRIRLCLLFAVGFISCLASVMRMVVENHPNPDFAWHYGKAKGWTITDITLSCIVASLPMLNRILDLVVFEPLKSQVSSLRHHLSKRSASGGSSAGSLPMHTSKTPSTNDSMHKNELDGDEKV